MHSTILFLYGEDTFRSSQKLRALRDRYRDANLGETNLVSLDGANLTFEEYIRQAQALPFLAKSRLVILENLLLAGKKEVQEQVSSSLEKVPVSTVLVFYEAGLPDKRTKLFRVLARPKLAEEFVPLVDRPLRQWIQGRATELTLQLSPAIINWLARVIGSDLWRMDQEIHKLADFTRTTNQSPTEKILAELVIQDPTADTFQLVDSLVRKQGQTALDQFGILSARGEAPLAIFGLIAYQYRTLLLLAAAFEKGRPSPAALAKTLKIHPFVVQKLSPLAQQTPRLVWQKIYKRLLEYDLRLKTGLLEPETGLELLIGELVTAQS